MVAPGVVAICRSERWAVEGGAVDGGSVDRWLVLLVLGSVGAGRGSCEAGGVGHRLSRLSGESRGPGGVRMRGERVVVWWACAGQRGRRCLRAEGVRARLYDGGAGERF